MAYTPSAFSGPGTGNSINSGAI
ncbi:uncharacterized protein METZ01_LOCUS459814, partial [marine metagenome]